MQYRAGRYRLINAISINDSCNSSHTLKIPLDVTGRCYLPSFTQVPHALKPNTSALPEKVPMMRKLLDAYTNCDKNAATAVPCNSCLCFDVEMSQTAGFSIAVLRLIGAEEVEL